MTTFAAFGRFLLSLRTSNGESALQNYRWQLKSFLHWKRIGTRDLSEVTLQDVNEWTQAQIAKGLSGVTVAKRRKTLIWFLGWAADHEIIPINPIKPRLLHKIVIPASNRLAMTEELHEKIINSEQVRKDWPHWKQACVIAWHTGLRISDISMLLWSEVMFEIGTISRIMHKTRRQNKRIDIPMADELIELLKELKANPQKEWHANSPFVLPEMNGLYQSWRSSLTHQFVIICKKNDIPPGITFHSYRHAFISRLVNANVNHIVIRSITGQSLSMIALYSHVSMDAKRNALAKARNLLESCRNSDTTFKEIGHVGIDC